MPFHATRLTLIAGLAAAMLLGSAAQAHPKLVASTPAAGSTVNGKGDIELHFSETLVAQFSGASLAMTAMPGMKMGAPMAMGGVTTAVGEDGKTLIAHVKTPLPAGTYKLAWHAVSADTHRVAGSLAFKVK